MVGRILLVVVFVGYFVPQLISVSSFSNARYACGVRKQFGLQLTHKSEPGQWPWHAALFHKQSYICGGTLIDERHVLTAANCVNEYVKSNSTELLRIYLGLHFLDEFPKRVQVMNVSEVHVNPEYVKLRNNIALMVLSDIVHYSEFVISICLAAKVEDLVDKEGWIVRWDLKEIGDLSRELQSVNMLVVNATLCVRNYLELLGPQVSPAMLCASRFDGTGVCQGYGGSGVYFRAGDRWELRGITSFTNLECDTQHVGITNVPFYFEWIKQLTARKTSKRDAVPKRISERKCQKYRTNAGNLNGVCLNFNSPHTVAIIDRNQRHISSGSIISEKFVLTKAPNLADIFEGELDWDELEVRVGNRMIIKVLRGFLHPQYAAESYRHPVLLLKLKEPLTFNRGLFPACLATEETENLHDDLLLSGYTGQSMNIYQGNDNKVITSESCKIGLLFTKYSINEEEFCTVFQAENPFLASGIEGGALQTFNTRSCMYTIVGISKMLILKDANKFKYIGVFSREVTYLDWIEQVVWGEEVEDITRKPIIVIGQEIEE